MILHFLAKPAISNRYVSLFRTRYRFTSTMAGNNCVFCGIIAEDQKKQIIFQDDMVIVFNDVRPAAPHHFLIVPKEHISDAKVLVPSQKSLVEHMISTAHKMLTDNTGSTDNARLGFHWPPFHTVSHLHLHAIAPASDMGFMSKMMFKENSLWFVSPEYVLTRLSTEEAPSQ
uniref:Adenosine 5'-monophosphoramidase HINT3 n=1 Tax=Lygus hesperus TaxID=30085 RepID=A0A0A9W2L1_LYGHE